MLEVFHPSLSPYCAHLVEKVQPGGPVAGREQLHHTGHNPPLVLCLLQQPAEAE